MGLCTGSTELGNILAQIQESPIVKAAKCNRDDAVNHLLHADPACRFDVDDTGRTALHWATEYGYTKIVNTLQSYECFNINSRLSSDFVNIRDSRGQTALHIACNCRREDLAILLITSGCDLNIQDRSGNTPLHRAIRMHLEAAAIMMCNAGSNVNTRNDLLWTPVHEVARTGNENILRALINHNADLDALTENKMSPFLTAFFYHKIASKGNSYRNLDDVWKMLIESGCSLSLGDGHWTPLTAAISCDSTFIASLLLFSGCRLEKVGRWGRGILQDAFSCSEPMLVELIVRLGYIPTSDEVIYCCKQITMYSKMFMRFSGLGSCLHRDRQSVVKWLKERQLTPPTLSEFCRVSIRSAMNVASNDKSIVMNINYLPIPNKLKQFLALSDFTSKLMT